MLSLNTQRAVAKLVADAKGQGWVNPYVWYFELSPEVSKELGFQGFIKPKGLGSSEWMLTDAGVAWIRANITF